MMTLRSSPKVSVLLIESKQTIKAFDLTPYVFSFIKKKKKRKYFYFEKRISPVAVSLFACW